MENAARKAEMTDDELKAFHLGMTDEEVVEREAFLNGQVEDLREGKA